MLAHFALPGLFTNYELNKNLIELIKTNPEYFYDNHVVTGVYGVFPTSIWNGGRHLTGFCSIDKVKDIISYFNSNGIGCYLTYTNICLENEHLYDTFCNLCMENLCTNSNNGVIINSPLLENYLSKKYPSIKFISSTTKCIIDFEKLKYECQEKYQFVVPDYSFNHDSRLLTMPMREKLELLVNPYCCDNCQERLEHYLALSKSQLSYSNRRTFHDCPYILESFKTIHDRRKSFISIDDIEHVFLPHDISYFKIEGRGTNQINVIESYLYYLVKTAYIDLVREILRKGLR